MSEPPHGNTGRWLRRFTQSMSGEPRDLAELIEDLREASERGLFNGDALVMIEGVLAVADMQVRDIMVPRSQMVFVERDESSDKLVELAVESGHSRFPVIGEDRDQILGILLAKDLLRLQTAGEEPFEIREYMRPVVFVPESKRLNVLLKEFRLSHNHHRDVVVAQAKLLEEHIEALAFGDEHHRAHVLADLERFFARGLQPQQILRQQYSEDLIAIFADDREARVPRLHRQFDQFVRRLVALDEHHLRTRHHDVADLHVRDRQHAFDHHERVAVEQTAFARLAQILYEFRKIARLARHRLRKSP